MCAASLCPRRPSWLASSRAESLYSPYRNRDAALKRRNQVLEAMVETGAITAKERDEAVSTPLRVTPSYEVANEAPYFVDMVKDRLLENYSEEESDFRQLPRLHHTGSETAAGCQRSNENRHGGGRPALGGNAQSSPPESGFERAWRGRPPNGRRPRSLCSIPTPAPSRRCWEDGIMGAASSTGSLARRQPGSAFKPFVYATAFSAALNGSRGPVPDRHFTSRR